MGTGRLVVRRPGKYGDCQRGATWPGPTAAILDGAIDLALPPRHATLRGLCRRWWQRFGVEIDSVGRVFSGHNGGNTRGFHYVQGAYLQKGFSKHGPLSNPYAFGYFPPMAHHNVPVSLTV